MTELVLLISLFMVFYVYGGYPVLAAALGLVAGRPVRKGSIEPMVTIVIAAYNERDRKSVV